MPCFTTRSRNYRKPSVRRMSRSCRMNIARTSTSTGWHRTSSSTRSSRPPSCAPSSSTDSRPTRPVSARGSSASTASSLSDRPSLHVTTWGNQGAPVVMVHGSFTCGEDAWIQQRELADSYRLLVVDRCGHGQSADTGRFGFEEQADDLAGLLGKSAHLVGSSYGAVLALIVAQREARRIQSLTVIEPLAWSVARGHPAVEEQITGFSLTPVEAAKLGPDLAFSRFLEGIGAEPLWSALTDVDRRNTAASFQEPPLLEAPV